MVCPGSPVMRQGVAAFIKYLFTLRSRRLLLNISNDHTYTGDPSVEDIVRYEEFLQAEGGYHRSGRDHYHRNNIISNNLIKPLHNRFPTFLFQEYTLQRHQE